MVSQRSQPRPLLSISQMQWMLNKCEFDKRTVWKLINACNLRYNSQLTYAFKHWYDDDDDDGRQENVQLYIESLHSKWNSNQRVKIKWNGCVVWRRWNTHRMHNITTAEWVRFTIGKTWNSIHWMDYVHFFLFCSMTQVPFLFG